MELKSENGQSINVDSMVKLSDPPSYSVTVNNEKQNLMKGYQLYKLLTDNDIIAPEHMKNEGQGIVVCRKCGETGHWTKTCKN